ncbi:MAG: hypothetical protein M3P51_02845 [Chloroflexota bacterium]|nr:hypothetical protein [Chloroflexota bacterium]
MEVDTECICRKKRFRRCRIAIDVQFREQGVWTCCSGRKRKIGEDKVTVQWNAGAIPEWWVHEEVVYTDSRGYGFYAGLRAVYVVRQQEDAGSSGSSHRATSERFDA